jgi:hypothetical protein
MTIPGHTAAADEHLTALAAELASAEGSDPADPARVAAAAWSILSELNEATYARIDGERALALAIQASQASVIDARTGAADPLAHVRRFLAARGKMPAKGASTLVTLAWLGEPRRIRARRRAFRIPGLGHLARGQAAR